MKIVTLALSAMVMLSSNLEAQNKGNGKVVSEERNLGPFTAIKAECAVNVMLTQGPSQMIKVETDENLVNKIVTEVSSGTLILSCKSVNKATKLNIYITVPSLSKIEAGGAAKITGDNPFEGNEFKISAGGASKVNLNLVAEKTIDCETSGAAVATIKVKAAELKSETSGASNLKLSGMVGKHTLSASGVSNIKAFSLVTDETSADLSGVASVQVLARKKLNTDLSGASNISYFDNGKIRKVNAPGNVHMTFQGMDDMQGMDPGMADSLGKIKDDHNIIINTGRNSDAVIVQPGDKPSVIVNDNGVEMKVGNRNIKIGDEGVKILKSQKAHFNGHWLGMDLGINGYVNPSSGLSLPNDISYLDLHYNKSINVNLNFFEQNFNLVNNHFGLVTGMGLSWNNYRFDNNVRLSKTPGALAGSYDNTSGTNYQKSKLVVSYLTVPLLLEYQTNSKSRSSSFHVTGGIVGGLRIGSHTKYKFNDTKDKHPGDFYLSPFKVDAMAKIGWGIINLYGTYSLTKLFQTNKGPELYPFSIGLCLTDFSN